METVFLELVNRSITAGWFVLAVLLIRAVFRNAPRRIFCVLWGLAALRLICPVSWESVFSLVPSARTFPQEILYTAAPRIQSGVEPVDRAVNPVLLSSLAPTPGGSVNPTQIWSFVLSRVWCAGVFVLLAYALGSYVLLRRRVATATLLEADIRQSDRVRFPFVLGILRPCIYLPYDMDDADRAYVIAHERAHIRRRDHWWKPFGFVLLSVCWFHPLFWAAYGLFCRDLETACDERVIRTMEREERRAYSRALLNCSIRGSRRPGAVSPLAFGEAGVKERVRRVMNYRKPSFWLCLLVLAASAAAVVCLMTDPKPMEAGEVGGSRKEETAAEPMEAGAAGGSRKEEAAVEAEERLSTAPAEGDGFFADGQPLELLFASGAGSWGTRLTLYPDGSFAGSYEDNDNVTGPGYPRGTSYRCDFTGRFGERTPLTATSCSMTLEELDYEEAGREWIQDGVRCFTAEPLGLVGGETFTLYLPETEAEQLDRAFLEWWPDAYRWRMGSQEKLLRYGLCNDGTKQGFFTGR